MFYEDAIVRLERSSFEETLSYVASIGGADLIFTSPPYPGIARTYGQDEITVDWKFEDYQRLGDFIKPALKPGGHCLLNLDAPVREWRPGYGTERGFHPWKVMIDWAERVGLRVPDRLAYGRMGLPGAYEGRFRNDWEPLLWFQSVGGDGWFDKAPLSTSSLHPERAGLAGSRDAKGRMNRRIRSGDAVENGLKRRGTIWNYGAGGNILNDDALSSADHPARFCLRLASDVVRCFCPPGGLVVDPFTGSGTTLVAALDHGRRFAGGDLFARTTDGKPWVEVARDVARVRYAQQGLFG